MRFKLIACDVFLREICYYVARCPHIIDLEFTPLGSHTESEALRAQIQDKIDQAQRSEVTYDAILLCYGLCGNATAGLIARDTKLVLPRAHDCCTILLGSKRAFRKHFGDNPSLPFSSVGYIERSETLLRDDEVVSCGGKLYAFAEYVAVYGEENARYIFDQLRGHGSGRSDILVYIEMPFLRHLSKKEALEEKARAEGKRLVVLKGSARLIRNLVWGRWPKRDLCVIQPGRRVEGVYDWDEVVRSAGPE